MIDIDFDSPRWGPFIMRTKVTNEFCDEMLDRAKKCRVNYNEKLAGHLNHQYKFDNTDKRFFYDTLYPYFDKYIKEEAKWFSVEEPKNNSVALKPHSLWVNFMQPADFNPPHYHDGDYSFVLYIGIPKELIDEAKNYVGRGGKPGCIMFSTPSPNLPLDNYKSISQNLYTPSKGDFFIFSAHTNHMVFPYKSNVERISISGNMIRRKL